MRFKNDLDRNLFWSKLVVVMVLLGMVFDAVLTTFFLRGY